MRPAIRSSGRPRPLANGTTQPNPLATSWRFAYGTRSDGQMLNETTRYLQLNIGRTFKFGRQSVDAGLGIFNVFNTGAHTQWNTGANRLNYSLYLSRFNRHPPRAFRSRRVQVLSAGARHALAVRCALRSVPFSAQARHRARTHVDSCAVHAVVLSDLSVQRCRCRRPSAQQAARVEPRRLQPAALAVHRPRGQPVLAPSRACRATRSSTTPAPPRAASTRPPTAACTGSRSSTASRCSRSVARRRAVRSEHRLGRHRRGVHPQPHLGRPGHLQVHRRRQDVDAHGPREDRPHRPRRHRSAESRTSCSPARWATPTDRSRSAASFAPPTAARPGPRCCSSTRTPVLGLAMDPKNPRILFAGMWQFEIHTWGRESGGPGSGLFTSHDGGATWTKLSGQRPADADRSARWRWRSRQSNPEPRLRADRDRRRRAVGRAGDRHAASCGGPTTAATPGAGEPRSQRDGARALLLAHGRRARQRERGVLPHRVVRQVDRRRRRRSCRSRAASAGRRPPRHLDRSDQRQPDDRRPRPGPVDLDQPRADLVPPAPDQRADLSRHRRQRDSLQRLGNKQDEPSYRGPSNSRLQGGVGRRRRHSARHVALGRRRRERLGHARSGRSKLVWSTRIRLRQRSAASSSATTRTAGSSATSRSGRDQSNGPPAELQYRFVWDAPLHISPHDHNTIYVGSQHVHRTTDGGQSWQVISPGPHAERQDAGRAAPAA